MKKGIPGVRVNNFIKLYDYIKRVFCFRVLTACGLTALRWLYLHVSVNKQVILALLIPIYFFRNLRARAEVMVPSVVD